MTRFPIKFWLNDKENFELLKWVKDLTAKEKFTETAIEILDFVRKNGLENLKSLEALRREKLLADIEWTKSKTKLIKQKLERPIHEVQIPAETTTEEAHYAPEEKNLEKLINSTWNKFVGVLKKENRGWLITCNLCSTGFPMLPTQEIAVSRFKKHLEETHGEDLVRVA